MKIIINAVCFTTGFITGYLLGSRILKNKYNKKADEEIESVKKTLEEHYKKINSDLFHDNGCEKISNDLPKESKNNKESNETKTKYYNYAAQYSTVDNNENAGNSLLKTKKKPYIISTEEFEQSDYYAETLYLYKNGELRDCDGSLVKSEVGKESLYWRDLVGSNIILSILEKKDDCTYIRNDKIKMDFEILLEAENENDLSSNKISHMIIKDENEED